MSAVANTRSRGFTLVEMLLALTLMSMLLALTYGGMRAATRATDKGQEILEDSSRIRMAHQFVRQQLTQMLPLAYAQDEVNDDRIVFEGDRRSIRFVAPMPGYLGLGGPQVQELFFEEGENGFELVLSHALLQGFELEFLRQQEPIFLLGEISDAQFSFLARDENGEPAGWTSTWDAPSQLPLAVSLELEFNEDVYLRWPLLATSVRIDGIGQGGSNNLRRSYSETIQNMINRRGQRQ
ncbi:MAG: prepilin-type N-terminal cleavage/methylation domain-containing protein [Xanthomonadales bacterium]